MPALDASLGIFLLLPSGEMGDGCVGVGPINITVTVFRHLWIA